MDDDFLVSELAEGYSSLAGLPTRLPETVQERKDISTDLELDCGIAPD